MAQLVKGVNQDGSVDVKVNGGKARQAKVLTVGQDIAATNGITANVDVDAQVIFADDTVAVAVKLNAGVVYPYSIKKVTVGTGIVGLY